MEKMDKKLTDRELIDAALAWYEGDQSTEELRAAVKAYVQQNSILVPIAANAPAIDQPGVGSFERQESSPDGSKASLSDRKFEAYEVVSYQQLEPTDELVGGGGLMIDAWAMFYGFEDFLRRISFGLLSMQSLAVLFCFLISVAVMIGAWQINLSSERQKKATFKSMEVESSARNRIQPFEPMLEPPMEETNSLVDTELIVTPNDENSTPTAFKSETSESANIELDTALGMMEKAAWNDALATLQVLENAGRGDLQPLLSLLRIEVLIQKRDTASMEEARQLLMDCKCGEYEIVYDLLVTRWMLLGRADDRNRFLTEAASLPISARQRMSTWAHIRNGSKDSMNAVALEVNNPKSQSDLCDLLFLASFHFNVGKIDETVLELLEVQEKLRALQTAGLNKAESWLLETAKKQLTSKVDEILAMVNRQRSKQIN